MTVHADGKKLNVLLLCPHLSEPGGVAHYYSLVRKHFRSRHVAINLFHTGNTSGSSGSVTRVLRTARDLARLAVQLPRHGLVVLNPSLDIKAVVRDGLLHFVAKKIFRKKTIVFFHGWRPDMERSIDRCGKRLFRFIFNADRLIVLARQFRDTLIGWGFPPEKLRVETTTYEASATKGCGSMYNVVFLSRFSRGKGCLEAIRAVELLVGDFPALKLFMAGAGELADELNRYVESHGLERHVEFTGWLDEAAKHRLLQKCGVMLFPTNYGEGMPICLLEGMGAGLAVVTRPVAGIPDICADGTNGFLVESLDPGDFAARLRQLFQDPAAWKAMSAGNRRHAERSFEIRSVVQRLERLFLEAGQ